MISRFLLKLQDFLLKLLVQLISDLLYYLNPSILLVLQNNSSTFIKFILNHFRNNNKTMIFYL